MRRAWLAAALPCALLLAASACSPAEEPKPSLLQGRIVAFDAAFDAIVAPDAHIEAIADGFTWAEGPAWMKQGEYLLFNDVPGNTMYRWSERDGLSRFLQPSGYAGQDLAGLREPGANGLETEPAGTVLLADSGSRLVARLDPATKRKITLAASYDGKRFNSPNDLVRRRDGTVYFTDPPYGLAGIDESPLKALQFNGVYRLDRDGAVHVVDDTLRFPNGVAFSPDERTLYVSNSDASRPIWMAYELDERGDVVRKRVLADASDLVAEGGPGLPDGMCVAADGHLFASAPGGLLVMDRNGKRLGLIATGTKVSNCAFGDDGRMLYMTSHSFVARVRVKVAGIGFVP